MKQRQPLHHWTPTLHSLPLSQRTGKTVWLKMECYQPVGSYKIRGIGRLCQHFVSHGATHLVSSSGGNAGLAVAYAGDKLGVSTDVFMPTNSSDRYLNAIQAYGATTHLVGDSWDDANTAAEAFKEQHGHSAAFIPPFNHPLIWAGHATMIKEVAYDGIQPDAVLVAVGGGGLACGVLEGMEQQGWYDVPLIGVETQGAASFAASLAAGELVSLDRIDTIATTLGAKRIAPKLLEWSQEHELASIVLSDHSAAMAARRFADDHRVLIEPAAGAALAPVYEQHPLLEDHQTVLVIVCGGIGTSVEQLIQQSEI